VPNRPRNKPKTKVLNKVCVLDEMRGKPRLQILVGKPARLTSLPTICDLVHNFRTLARLPVTRSALAAPHAIDTMPAAISHPTGGLACSTSASGLAREMSRPL
jgi:hypothetical protein